MSNRARLEGFVALCLARAAALSDEAAARYLTTNADYAARQLALLSAWAARDDDAPCPPHLAGLTAFDLSDAQAALQIAADRRRRADPPPLGEGDPAQEGGGGRAQHDRSNINARGAA